MTTALVRLTALDRIVAFYSISETIVLGEFAVAERLITQYVDSTILDVKLGMQAAFVS